MKQNPIEQHLVPEVYLKRFAYDGKMVYRLPIKEMYPKTKVKSSSVSAICYKKDFFTIRTSEMMERFELQDPYHIERNAFDYENVELNRELNKLTTNGVIGRLKARRLIQILLDIKRRSQNFKDMFLNPVLIDTVSKKYLDALKASGEQYENRSTSKDIGVDSIINKVETTLKESFANPNFANDAYLESFVKQNTNDSKIKNLIDDLASHKFFIFRNSSNRPFITSDNPGFTLIKGDQVRSTAFSAWQVFGFPIDPFNLLILYRGCKEESGRIFKSVTYIDADSEMLRFTNNAAIELCNKLIISNRKEVLDEIKDRWLEAISIKNK